MILNAKDVTIAYRCPYCGTSVMSVVGVFALTGDFIKLKCNCGQSELTISYTADRKIRLLVPCLICPKPHHYVISSNVFFDRDIFTLSCSFSAIAICFIGKKTSVLQHMKAAEEELMQMLSDAGLDDFDRLRSEDKPFYNNPEIIDTITFVIHDLAEEGEIHCKCDNGDYEIQIEDKYVLVFCKNCGASTLIPADSMATANEFLSCKELRLN